MQKVLYEFRKANGRVCCRVDDPGHLCKECKAKLGQLMQQRQAAAPSSLEVDESEWSAPGPAPNWSDPPTPVPAVRAAAAPYTDADLVVNEDDWSAPDIDEMKGAK